MSDNTTLNTGTGGDVIASDDIGGVKFQRIKLILGDDGSNDGDISAANPLPITGALSAVGVSNVVSVAAVGVSNVVSIAAVGVSSAPITDVRVSSGSIRVSSIVAIGVSSMPTTAVTQSGGWSIGVSSAPTTAVTQSGGWSIGVSSAPTTAVTQSGAWSIGVSSTAAIGVSSVATHGVTQAGAFAIGVSSVTQVTSVTISTNSATASNFAAFTNAGGLTNYITAYSVFNTSSTSIFVDLRDSSSGPVLWSIPAPANATNFGGANLANGGMPLFKTTASTHLAYDLSAAVSSVYLSISGFRA